MSTPSQNDTLITPGVGEITDTSGDVFSITNDGTVDLNGSPLGYTANVIAAAYVNGHFWQENSSYLWWEYTGNTSSPWIGFGTGTSPSNTFIMNGGTINLAHAAVTLQLVGNNSDTINLNGNDTVTLNGGAGLSGDTINVNAPGATIHSNFTTGEESPVSINPAANNSLRFTGTLSGRGELYITGNGTLINDGDIDGASYARIDSNVVGTGTIAFTSTHDSYSGHGYVSRASSGGLTYELPTTDAGVYMTVEHPVTFLSKVDMGDASSLTLAGLAATSYDFKNNFLTLYKGNSAVYRLHLTDQSATEPITVTSGTGGVTVDVWAPVLGPAPIGLSHHTPTV